jgi:quercetin dioxygenase-like cupin family protein
MADVRAVPTVQIDEVAVRVTEWRLPPGAVIDWHRHEYPYVVVPMTTGRLASKGKDGETTADLVTGRSYSRPEGVEHQVRNVNPFEFVFVEIEIKPRP